MHETIWILAAVVIIALAFDYVNGFHDAANAIATVVSTRALSPRTAVLMAACCNFCGALLFTGVAKTITSGIVEGDAMNSQSLILSALIGAIIWNLLTWVWGLPSSSSHALVGGLVGVALARVGTDGVKWWGVMDHVVIPGLVSPLIGLILGYCIMLSLYWILRHQHPSIGHKFKYAQWLSSSLMAFSHGSNDAQKVMGIITLALCTATSTGLIEQHWQPDLEVRWFTKVACATVIALGTSGGGWRIIKTLGAKVVRLQPVHGFAADLTSSTILLTTAALGMPISTTHVITASIMGVGAVKRINAVRWSIANNILVAWVFTLPAAATMSAITYHILKYIDPALYN